MNKPSNRLGAATRPSATGGSGGQMTLWDEADAPPATPKAMTWRAFVKKSDDVLSRWPAAVEITSELTHCPRHETRIGPVTRICSSCHDEAWAELGRMYLAQGRPKEDPPRGLVGPKKLPPPQPPPEWRSS